MPARLARDGAVGVMVALAAWGLAEAWALALQGADPGPRVSEIAPPPDALPPGGDWVSLVDAACVDVEAVGTGAPMAEADRSARFRGGPEVTDLRVRVFSGADLARMGTLGPTPLLRGLARWDRWSWWNPQARRLTKLAVDFDAAVEALDATPVVLFLPLVTDESARSYAGAEWVEAIAARGVEVLVPFGELRDAGSTAGNAERHRAVAAHVQRWLGDRCGPLPVVRTDAVGAVPVARFDGLDVSFKTE
jgi:hypothetical protein